MSAFRRLAFISAFILFTGLSVSLRSILADIGPKPTMDFHFAYEISTRPTILAGSQLECSQPDCSDAEPLREMGPQRFGCEAQACSSMAYGYADYHRLSITFSDGKTRLSNIFGKKYFSASYLVMVRENDLQVQEQLGQGMPFLFWSLQNARLCLIFPAVFLPLILLILIAVKASDFQRAWQLYDIGWVVSLIPLSVALLCFSSQADLVVTLIVEMGLALGYAFWRKRPKVLLLTVVWMMNLVTQPVYSVFVRAYLASMGNPVIWTILAEALICLVEAGILALALRRQVKAWEALALSAVLNLASFGIGLLLPV